MTPQPEKNSIAQAGVAAWQLFDSSIFPHGSAFLREVNNVASIASLSGRQASLLSQFIVNSRQIRIASSIQKADIFDERTSVVEYGSRSNVGIDFRLVDTKDGAKSFLAESYLDNEKNISFSFVHRPSVISYSVYFNDTSQSEKIKLLVAHKPVDLNNMQEIIYDHYRHPLYSTEILDYEYKNYPNDVFYMKVRRRIDFDMSDTVNTVEEESNWFQKLKEVSYMGGLRPVYVSRKNPPEGEQVDRRKSSGLWIPSFQTIAGKLTI